MAIGTDDGRRYESEFEMLSSPDMASTMPSIAPEKPAGELKAPEGTQVAMMRKEQFVGTRSGEGGGGLSRETITGAAIKTGKEIHTGPNHSLIAVKLPDKALDKAVDGFMTSSGRFVTREEAAKIVKNNGQERSEFYKEKRSGFSLGTEDLKDLLPGSSKAWQEYLGQ